MKKALLIIFAGFVLITPNFIHSADSQVSVLDQKMEKYVNQEKKYEILYPKNWVKREAPAFDLVLVAQSDDPKQAITATMNLISEYIGKSITVDTFFNENVPTISKELKNSKIVGQGEQKLNGVTSKWIQYSHEMNNIKFEVLQYFVIHDGYAYLLTFSSIANEYPKYEKEFKSIAETFKILNAPAQNGKSLGFR